MLKTVFNPGSVLKEHANHHTYSPRWKPDITVFNYDGRGRHILLDVSVAFPCCATYIRAASRNRLAAAIAHEAAKTTLYQGRRDSSDYPACGNHLLVPFAVEAFGALGPAAKRFFDSCAQRRHDRLQQELEDATWATRSFRSYWLQRLMVKLRDTQGHGVLVRAMQDNPVLA
jgi:hypothetical protein